ncbi:response regulator [Blautia obeum]|jgi:two-component system response regulator YesN|uniref:Stage 0 sporulation protein A homolog n=1 Tax=Blautia obeum TaxID=40520 RepID=A0A4Q5GHR0_9FIRM|nr:response regulator [Blautia obeum]MZT68432.1 response regulator [Blautia obeum]NSG06832.1 response regulator [Blautia obeum]NSG28184.1 response regulator [Blautia obeum]RYT67777.1 response regulator [Blautia obeum]
MLKIFLAEDEVVVRETIKRMIPWEELGFELVGEAADGEMALPLLIRQQPDLLITDIKMPFMDGLTLARLAKKEIPGLKVVILSGYDDFNYAKQAIGIGVEDYLLKPITKNALIERLSEIRSRYEHEKTQKEYYEKFQREMQAYEKNSSRDFFEALVGGSMDMMEVYKRAEKLGLDIVAEAYNVLIFTMNCDEDFSGQRDEYSSWEAESLELLENFFAGHSSAMLFRSNIFSYGVLLKGQRETIEENTRACVDEIRKILSRQDGRREWFLAVGQSVERLSQIQKSYHTASRAFSQRYLYDENILYYDEMETMEHPGGQAETEDNAYLQKVDVNALNPAILQKFLSNGLQEETENFVKDYFYAIGQEPMESLVFRNYVILNVRFSVISFIKGLGCDTNEMESADTEEVLAESGKNMESAIAYAKKMISQAIEIRDQNSGNKNRSILKTVVDFIDSHYMDEEISLNTVANVANVSSNHFSALFSQNMGQTFIEYLTTLRMNKAKELLRCTGMRSSEIAGEIGYKDAHYFSYLFKKTQGMTPSDYRKAREDKA